MARIKWNFHLVPSILTTRRRIMNFDFIDSMLLGEFTTNTAKRNCDGEHIRGACIYQKTCPLIGILRRNKRIISFLRHQRRSCLGDAFTIHIWNKALEKNRKIWKRLSRRANKKFVMCFYDHAEHIQRQFSGRRVQDEFQWDIFESKIIDNNTIFMSDSSHVLMQCHIVCYSKFVAVHFSWRNSWKLPNQ